MTATRVADDPTEIVVTWTVTDNLVNKLKLEILEDGEGSWSAVSGASDMTTSTTQFRVKNLKADAKYKFRLDMRRPGENNPTYVESNEGRSRVKTFLFLLAVKPYYQLVNSPHCLTHLPYCNDEESLKRNRRNCVLLCFIERVKKRRWIFRFSFELGYVS